MGAQGVVEGAVAAQTVTLGVDAEVGRVLTDSLVDHGATHGPTAPLSAVPAFPAIASGLPGSQNITAASITELPPGSWGVIDVAPGAELRLVGGIYDVAHLRLGTGSTLTVLATSVVRVAGRLRVGAQAIVAPVASASVALNLRIEVEGEDEPQILAASTGANAQLTAVIVVPNGTFWLGDSAVLTGSVSANGVHLGRSAQLSAFPDAAYDGIDAPSPCRYDYCLVSVLPGGPVSCTRPPVAAGVSCADRNACNGVELCDGLGTCAAGSAPTTDDGNACTADSCDPTTGAIAHVALADGASCADADGCDGIETCQASICTSGVPAVVDDQNPCTADACDPVTGIVAHLHMPDGASCDADADPCNGSGSCAAGACQAIPALGFGDDCSDGNPCNGAERCDSGHQCAAGDALAEASNCSDGDPCNGMEACDALGACVAASAPAPAGVYCAAGAPNPCVPATCDGLGACAPSAALVGEPCSDGNPCTGADACDATGACVGSASPLSSCDDGDACNGIESCDAIAGACVPGTPIDVDDGVPQTLDMCDAATGTVGHSDSGFAVLAG